MAQKKAAVVADIFDGIEGIDDLKTNSKSKRNCRWPDAVVPYVIDKSIRKDMVALIKAAIKEFDEKTPINWKPYEKNLDKNYVVFEKSNGEDAFSQIGCIGGRQLIGLTPKYIPGTRKPWTKVGIMHEMMHTLGFVHEQQRKDAKQHHSASNLRKYDSDFITSDYYKCIGNYDYQSIMHYACCFFDGTYIDKQTEEEMKKWVDKGETFSKGDIAAIKLLYGLKDSHYGVWHPPCKSKHCTAYVCHCGSCGVSKPWCGWHGKRNTNGHWTCCMREYKNVTTCHSKGHTGFWHMECEKTCPDKGCKCGSCGAGCKYVGKKAHWSCCRQEKFDAWCTNTPFLDKKSGKETKQ